jgi:hypothetical protein
MRNLSKILGGLFGDYGSAKESIIYIFNRFNE